MEKKTIRFQSWTFPIVALVVLFLTFGVMFPLLGLYWDDWPAVAAARLKGVSSFWEFYKGERPFSAWTYILTMPWLGTKPITWHIVTLLLRWLTVLAMGWTLRGLWPNRSREVAWMTLLFAIYPVFINQAVAVAFSQHWMTFLLYFISLGFMIQALRKPRFSWLFTSVALLAEILHVLTMEYFWGLELIRPFFLWIILSEQNLPGRQRFKKTLLFWLPYLLVLVIGLVMRMTVFVTQTNDPNRPDLLFGLKEQPFVTLIRLLQFAIQDFVNNLAGVWYNTLAPGEIDLTDRVYLFSLLIAGLIAGLVFYYMTHMKPEEVESDVDRSLWIKQALLIGFVCTLLGPVPVWLTDRQVLWGMYGGRFGLAAEFGLSIFLFGLFEWFTVKPLPKILLVSVLIGLAGGYHIRVASTYYRSTLKQNQFYWQLFWRAPYLKPGTAILSADELFPYVGRAASAVTMNLLYVQPAGSPTMAYWFFELDYDIGPKAVPKLSKEKPLNAVFRNFVFNGNSLDNLVVFYKSGTGRCLWVLSPEDVENSDLPELTLQALPVSNLSRIEAEPIPVEGSTNNYPPADLFGKEPEHDWCYFFQKANLARQYEEWEKVAQLGDEAQNQGLVPQDAHEWLPFIQGYAFVDQWEKAINRTDQALVLKAESAPRLCTVWEKILSQTAPSQNVMGQIEQMKTRLSCPAH